jgi:acylglycerol lipase
LFTFCKQLKIFYLNLLIFSHGLYEHSNSNANIAKFLAENGYEVLSFDQRGHGKSEGIRGYYENKEVMTDDINKFISLTESEYSNKTKNKYILGYSLGGLLSNLVTLSRPDYFNGMILLAPAFYADTTKHSNIIKIARMLNYVCPTLPLIELEGKRNLFLN